MLKKTSPTPSRAAPPSCVSSRCCLAGGQEPSELELAASAQQKEVGALRLPPKSENKSAAPEPAAPRRSTFHALGGRR